MDKETLEEQRKYLGGDADHTVLVKGLDFALLEQNRAKVAAEQGVEDDDALEQVFLETRSTEKTVESAAPSTTAKSSSVAKKVQSQMDHVMRGSAAGPSRRGRRGRKRGLTRPRAQDRAEEEDAAADNEPEAAIDTS